MTESKTSAMKTRVMSIEMKVQLSANTLDGKIGRRLTTAARQALHVFLLLWVFPLVAHSGEECWKTTLYRRQE